MPPKSFFRAWRTAKNTRRICGNGRARWQHEYNSEAGEKSGKIVQVDADAQQQLMLAANTIDLAETDTILPGMIEVTITYF